MVSPVGNLSLVLCGMLRPERLATRAVSITLLESGITVKGDALNEMNLAFTYENLEEGLARMNKNIQNFT